MCAAPLMISAIPTSYVAFQHHVGGDAECDGRGTFIPLEEQQQQQQEQWVREERVEGQTEENEDSSSNKLLGGGDENIVSGVYSPREASSPLLHSSRLHKRTETTADEVMVVEGYDQDIEVDWDKVNRETEERIVEETINDKNGISEWNTPITFLDAADALKRDTSSWEPYIKRNCFNENNYSNCLKAFFYRLLRRCDCCLSHSSRYNGGIDAVASSREGDTGVGSSVGNRISGDSIRRILQRDVEFTLALPSVPFDNGQMIHHRLLVTVYNGLLYRTSSSSRRSGGGNNFHNGTMNWERIGFQGADPATDLRSTGLIGLLQLVYLIEYYSEFTSHLWETCNASISEDDVFTKIPFVLIAFGFSAMLLERLREDAFRSDLIHRARRMCATGRSLSNARANSIVTNHLRHEFPMLLVCCEYLVGSLFLFWERWVQLREQRGGRPPTIHEYGAVKLALCLRMKTHGVQYVLGACAKARDPSVLQTPSADVTEDTMVGVEAGDAVHDVASERSTLEEAPEERDTGRENGGQGKQQRQDQEEQKQPQDQWDGFQRR